MRKLEDKTANFIHSTTYLRLNWLRAVHTALQFANQFLAF